MEGLSIPVLLRLDVSGLAVELAGVLALSLLIWAGYRLRIAQVARQLNLRSEERLMERTRVAEGLHDTLLQGFLSASMQLDVAAGRLPPDSPVRAQLNHILEMMAAVSTEGRNALQSLRSPEGASVRLEQALAQLEQEFASEPAGLPPVLRIAVEGHSQPLHPLLRDELYCIVRETIVNAFRHSHARNIEVLIAYSKRQFRLVVHDDGCGIESDVLSNCREIRRLSGMRDRAGKIAARLRVWSRAGEGTKIELSVPGRVAYRCPTPHPQFLQTPIWPPGNTWKVVYKDSEHQ